MKDELVTLSRRGLLIAGGATVTAGLAQSCAMLRGGASHPEWSPATELIHEGRLRVPASELSRARAEGGLLVTAPEPHEAVLLAARADGSWTAVGADCTHWGCTVDYDPAKSIFVCPCHGSRFDADGKVLEGPAEEALPTYACALDGEELVIVLKG